METKPEQRLKAQVVKYRAMARYELGYGIWGLETKTKFTHDEIVFLFARIFRALGFDYIKKIQTEFPDCYCIRENQEVGIEFEPVLSLFGNHIQKHDLNLCQYIVCWEDDLKLDDSISEEIKKFNIKTIQLKDIYEETKRRGPGKSELEPIDIDKLKENQLKILKVFIKHERDILSGEEIAEATGFHAKLRAGSLSSFKLIQKGKIDWILRRRPDEKWEINPQHKSKIIEIIKRFGI